MSEEIRGKSVVIYTGNGHGSMELVNIEDAFNAIVRHLNIRVVECRGAEVVTVDKNGFRLPDVDGKE